MLSGGLGAQSPDWSSVLTISPNASPYLADWERVPSTALLSLTYTGASAADFRVRVTLNSAERGLIGTTESPVVTLAGGPSSFLYNVRDVVFEWTTVSRNPSVTDGARKTGQIPEGTYQACARVFVGTSTTPVTEDCAEFSILQPDPPQLLMPQDRDVVVSTQPFFQWTPVLTPPTVQVSYELTVVELLGMQVPRTALEANIPVFKDVASTPFLIYPIDALQLERTKRYAWRIRAVDAEGRQLFRDGASSEIWTFEMSDDLLRPVGKVADLPDTLVLMPGVAQLTGVRAARLRRTETDVEIDGSLVLEFLGAGESKRQRVNVAGLRAGFRGDELSLLSGRIEAAVPEGSIPAEIRPFVSFAPLVFTPTTGFRATATLKIPGSAAVPLSGAVQLTSGGLFGRLEGAGVGGAPIARVGRAPVQFAANSARLTLPDGRLEFAGKVLLFEQDVGCPVAGPLQGGAVRLPVFCDPTSGFRPDTSSSRSLLSFGTVSGALAADFMTDTLGTYLQTPATFSVFGEGDASCALQFTLGFARDSIWRADEQQSCAVGATQKDFGWVKLAPRNLRITRLEYAPGATLAWRALVDLDPSVRGADNLQLPTIRDVVLDNGGVQLPSTSSSAPGTSTSGIVELDGVEVLPVTMGFRGGQFSYARWLGDRDPGLEWGSATSWLGLPKIVSEVSRCIDAAPFTVDTLILKAGVLDAALEEKSWESGCRLHAGTNINLDVRTVGGRVRIALDSVPRVTELPLITGGIVHPKPDCGIPVIGCLEFMNFDLLTGTMHLTQTGRVRGLVSGFKPSWAEFDLRFAKLKLAGGALALGVDSAGAQTAIYDGSVKVTFGNITDTTKDSTARKDSTAKADTGMVAGAAGTAKGLGGGLLGSESDTATTIAKIDVEHSRLLAGTFVLKGPFTLKLGIFTFIASEATLDTTGLTVDGRQRLLAKRTTLNIDSTMGRTKPDTTYSSVTDTVAVTFARVRLDPGTGEVSSGTITLDAGLGLETNPVGMIGTAGLGIGVVAGTAAVAGKEVSGAAVAGVVDDANAFAFEVVRATAPFNPGTSTNLTQITGGNIRLTLPGTPTIDSRGLRLSGTAPSNVSILGKRFDAASVSFENGFAIRPVAATISDGRAMVSVKEYPIAYADRSGWHLALAELAQTLIPDTLFLFDRMSAYVVLRDADKKLLVSVVETEEGPRITTTIGTPVKIVIPALKGSRASAPALLIAMDLTLEKGTWRPLAGDVRAMAGGSAEDDFNDNGLPFALDSVIFRATRGADPSFFAHGRLDVWPGASKPMRVALGFLGAGEISASLEQSFVDELPLVSGSELVKFHIDTLRFSAQGKLGGSFQWLLETPGRLAYFDSETSKESVLARTTFRLSPTEAGMVNFATTDSLTTVRLPGVDLRLGRIRVPTFRWDFTAQRFDFELLFDVGLQIPALDSLKLPEIRDIRLTPQGLVIPAFEMASTPVTPEPGNPFVTEVQELRVGGFSVKVLAYRVSEFRWNWFAGAPPPQFNFGVDLEFGIEDLPSGLEGEAARISLRALNVGITNGRFTGSFEPLQIPTPIRTPVADIRGAFGSFSVADGQVPDIRIGVIADLRLPDVLACPDAASKLVSLSGSADTLFLASNGTLRGSIRNVIPTCPMDLGPFDLRFGTSTARFGFDPATQRVEATLDAAATLTVPGDSPGETVSATGRIVIDIANARIADASIAIDEPFFWAPDPANPFLKLIVSEAALTLQELRFGATGRLRTVDGAGVDVAFENVAFNLNTLRLTSGRIRLTADAAVGIEIPESGELLFGVYPVTTPRGTTASARLVLPTGALIDSLGLHVNGTASASLGFGGETYAALDGEFADDFTISVAGRVAISRGRINLRNTGGDLIAYADSLGFWPGNVFAVLPIPTRLGIPSVDVAYIQLRNGADTTQLLVETIVSGETVRLRTRPNQMVEVGIPALANAGPVPTVMAAFDLVLNTRNLRPISGELALEAAPGNVLIALEGMPISITQLGFRADTGGFRLRVGAKATLPGPLAGVNLEFRNLEVTAQGLTGVVELGEYSETFNPNATPIITRDLLGDTLSIAFTGAELTLDAANTRVRISGAIRSSLFELPTGGTRVIALAATVDNTGFRATADVSDAEQPIPIGVAELTLQAAPGQPTLIVEANAQEFAITLGGALRLPTIAPGFSLGVEGMRVGSAGVSIPNVSITAPANTKEFDLFGARFALRDSTVGTTQVAPAIGIQLNQGVMLFTLSGYVTILQNTTRFIGLRFGTDGAFSIQGASFISKPIDLIPNVARFVSANITNGGLELRGDVQLPAPFAQAAPQELMVRIMPDGRITGGGKVIIINEPAGLATAQTKLSIGVAAFHLRHLALELDFATQANNAVSVVADIYIQEKQANLVRFGSVQGGTVAPGLRVALSGAVTFGNIHVPAPITLDMDPVTIILARATSTTTATGFTLSINGSVGLKLAGASGSLAFQNLGFTSEGEVKIGQAQFNGGTFTIQNTVRIVVGRIAWSDSDTSIYVPRAGSGRGESVQQDSALVAVSSFIDFGASVDIANTFAGGVDRVLVYVQQSDETTHFLIDNLFVDIPGVLLFNASMSYDQLPDGFDLALSARGKLLSSYDIALVGVMGKRAEVFRAGLFLRMRLPVPIVIVPGIVSLTEVGGGLFVNPTPGDLLLVKNAAGLNGPSANRIGMPPAGAFAVMLYAGFSVAGTGGAAAAEGKAMVTITDMAFQINATATFFKMNDKITGDLALQVGWTPAAYVRGDISLVVSIPKTVSGTASIQFFAGSNIFAIKGNVDLMVIEVVQAYAEVIIVPSGFTANLGFRVQKQTAVVGVLFAANLRMWYRPSTNDLGAYLKLIGQVTVFGVTGEIGLIGALVIQPELAIYAQGSARIVGIDALQVEVWVQYTSAGVEAGVGHNEELAAVLANAEQIARELEAEADAILAGIDAAAQQRARTPIAVSEASLVAAFQNFQQWNWLAVAFAWGGFRTDEGRLRGGLLPTNATDAYVSFYERILTNSEAAADTALVRQLREEATQKLAVITDRRAAVEERIRALRLELDAAESAAAFIPPPDPVTQFSSGAPSLAPGPAGIDGKPTMIVLNPPVFELDDQLAADARSAMTAAQAATEARPSRLRAQVDAVEAGLATVIAATTASDAGSFASYARVHSEAVEAIEHQHAANVDFRMRGRSRAQARLDTLAQQRAGLQQRLSARLGDISAYQAAQTGKTDVTRRFGTAVELDTLATSRAKALSRWSGDPSILSGYLAAATAHRAEALAQTQRLRTDPTDGAASAKLDLEITWFQTQADSIGLYNWWTVANSGLTVARDGSQALVDEANTAAVPVIRAMRDMHARFTTDLAGLNSRQADLYGVLYDLYDAYLRTYGAADSIGQRYSARRTALNEMLMAPSVTNPRVTVTDFGYLSSVNTTWTGTHPRGVYEYLIQDGGDSLFTVGAQGTTRRWQYTVDPAGGSTPRNQTVSVRGGAGSIGSALTPYTVTFLRGTAGNPVTNVAIPPVDLSPPSVPVVRLVGLLALSDLSGSQQFWTGDSTRVVASWSASDAQSGIAEYEYRVVTLPVPAAPTGGMTTLRSGSFTRMSMAELTPVVIMGWTSAGGRTSATIQGLSLPPNRLIFVEVRAKNGAGLVGSEGASEALRYDPTPPVFPAGAAIAPAMIAMTQWVTMGTYTIPGSQPLLLPVCGSAFGRGAVPAWDGKLVTVTPDNAVVGGGATAQIAFTLPTADDPETGVLGYHFRVDSVPSFAMAGLDGWSVVVATGATFTAGGPDFAYGRPRYVSLAARNAGGRLSAPLRYGPITVTDPSQPSAPGFCADYSTGGVIAFMNTPSVDAESGVRGYQLRVLGPTGAIVRDFPAGSTVDWPASQAIADRGIRLPFTPTAGGLHIVALRAVNGAGAPGGIAGSGQVMIDVTRPPVAGVTATYVSGRAILDLTLANDPESGLAGVDVAFGNTAADPTLDPKSGGILYAAYAPYAAVVGVSKLTIPLPLSAVAPVWAYVRVRNGAGLISTATVVRVR